MEFYGLVGCGKGFGVMFVDIDNDYDFDIYVMNDLMFNFFYINDGVGNFEESVVLLGVVVDNKFCLNGSMGVVVYDFNGDELFDIGVLNFEFELYVIYQ